MIMSVDEEMRVDHYYNRSKHLASPSPGPLKSGRPINARRAMVVDDPKPLNQTWLDIPAIQVDEPERLHPRPVHVLIATSRAASHIVALIKLAPLSKAVLHRIIEVAQKKLES